jgi:hypothetical protein
MPTFILIIGGVVEGWFDAPNMKRAERLARTIASAGRDTCPTFEVIPESGAAREILDEAQHAGQVTMP